MWDPAWLWLLLIGAAADRGGQLLILNKVKNRGGRRIAEPITVQQGVLDGSEWRGWQRHHQQRMRNAWKYPMFRPWTTLAKVGLVVAPFIILTFYHQPSLPITSCHLEPHYLSGFSIPRIHGTGNKLTNFRNNSMISLQWRFISSYLIFFCSFRIKTTHLLLTLWTFLTYLIAPWDYLSNSSPSFHSRSYIWAAEIQ